MKVYHKFLPACNGCRSEGVSGDIGQHSEGQMELFLDQMPNRHIVTELQYEHAQKALGDVLRMVEAKSFPPAVSRTFIGFSAFMELFPRGEDWSSPKILPFYDAAKDLFKVREICYTPAPLYLWNGLPFCYGDYSWRGERRISRRKIKLYSHDLDIWFHELGHAVHHSFESLRKDCRGEPKQELVASFFSMTLCKLYGLECYLFNQWRLAELFLSKDPEQAFDAVYEILPCVEECLRRLFK